MIVFGIFLLIVAVMNPELVALWGIGIIAIFVGLVLAVCRRRGQRRSAAGATTTDLWRLPSPETARSR